MSEEKQLTSNNALINFTSDYEYVLGQTMGRALDFAGSFSRGDFLRENVEQIAYDLEDTAKMFAAEQGLAPGELGTDGKPNTGRLYNGIHATVDGRGKGYTAHLKSTAQDDRGNYYGGHVEFGHLVGGKTGYVVARPHLRPALYAVSQASRNKLASVMHNLFKSIVMNETGLNYSFRKSANFGSSYGGSPKYYRQGPGNVSKSLSSGQRGRMMRNNLGWNTKYSRNFRSQFSVVRGLRNSASMQMGWGFKEGGRSLSASRTASYASGRKVARGVSARRKTSFGRRQSAMKRKQTSQYNRLKKTKAAHARVKAREAKNERSRQLHYRKMQNEKYKSSRITKEASTLYPLHR